MLIPTILPGLSLSMFEGLIWKVSSLYTNLLSENTWVEKKQINLSIKAVKSLENPYLEGNNKPVNTWILKSTPDKKEAIDISNPHLGV